MLRYRRLDLVLELSLLVAIALGLAGLLVVLVLDPLALALAIPAGVAIGLGLARAIGEGSAGGLVLGGVIALLGIGLYAVYLLLDLSWGWAAGLAGGVLALFATVLGRANTTTPDEPGP